MTVSTIAVLVTTTVPATVELVTHVEHKTRQGLTQLPQLALQQPKQVDLDPVAQVLLSILVLELLPQLLVAASLRLPAAAVAATVTANLELLWWSIWDECMASVLLRLAFLLALLCCELTACTQQATLQSLTIASWSKQES